MCRAMTKEAIINGARIMDALMLADSLRTAGDYVQAREYVADELKRTPGGDERLALLDMAAKIERSANRPAASLCILLKAEPLAEASLSHDRKAKYHHGLAVSYQMLGEIEQALEEYRAASYHMSEAEQHYPAACIENNVALILSGLGRFDEARTHLREARRYLTGWPVKLAEVDETEAQILLAEGRSDEAEALVVRAMAVFYENGEAELIRAARYTLLKAAADCQAATYDRIEGRLR